MLKCYEYLISSSVADRQVEEEWCGLKDAQHLRGHRRCSEVAEILVVEEAEEEIDGECPQVTYKSARWNYTVTKTCIACELRVSPMLV